MIKCVAAEGRKQNGGILTRLLPAVAAGAEAPSGRVRERMGRDVTLVIEWRSREAPECKR